MAKIVHDNLTMAGDLMMTVHGTTATQKGVDGSSKKDWPGRRIAALNTIPLKHRRGQDSGQSHSGPERQID
jgi:glyceraldehyde 3-phosphate dehydrogenase